MLTDAIPRLKLTQLPTPIESLPRLSQAAGGPELFVKRDDCTGLGAGGNKTRKLEYLLADAIRAGATTLITAGGLQSNHARLTAAAACRVGLECDLVLDQPFANPTRAYTHSGNLLLDRLFGARIHELDPGLNHSEAMAQIAAQVQARGGVPYVVPIGGSNALGALGYVRCAEEILQQVASSNLQIDLVVLASGSGGTQAGLLTGLRAAGSTVPVLGMGVSSPQADQHEKVRRVAEETALLLGLDPVAPEDIRVNCEHIGAGYGLPTDSMIEAVSQTARLEGLLLDPVYTGKAMAGLLEEIKSGALQNVKTVLFLHTGGVTGLFGYPDLF